MQKIAIITDSSSDLSLDTLKQHNIKLFPLRIIYSHGEFEDKVTITSNEVYDSLDIEIPTTSLPSAKTAEKVLNEIEAEGYTHVIAISVSAALSGTYNAFRLALENHPNLTSYVFNSRIIGYALGALVLEAANMVKCGKTYEEIIEALPLIRKNITGYFTLNTLEYLTKGGRIGKIAGAIGQVLHIKPIISMDDEGLYSIAGKARGRKQSLSKMIDLLKEHLAKSKCKVWILEGSCLEEATAFMNSIKSLNNIEVMGITQVGAMVAVHSGRGMIGLAIQHID